ncbi:MAG TPA: DUF6587 family protein [Steroidobacteraceae bacterium]|nr:DUF6587 family protein [Steroidobacteraceae bacterium]
MEYPLQTLIVAVVVLASAVFAAWRLSPARLKLRLLDRMRPDTAGFWGRWLARRRNRVAEELMHGCSACSRAPDHVKRASR